MNQARLIFLGLMLVFNISAFAKVAESDVASPSESLVGETLSSDNTALRPTRNQLSQDYLDRLDRLATAIGQTPNSNFTTNIKNVLSNFQCGQESAQAPQLLLACDYPKASSQRRTAKCFLINNQTLEVVASSNVVYGQGGLVTPGQYKPGQNRTPLGLFLLDNPNSRVGNPRGPSQIARISDSMWGRERNPNFPGMGPIFYPQESTRVYQASLGSPVFFGDGARQILNEMSGQRTMMLNSTAGVNAPARCNQNQ